MCRRRRALRDLVLLAADEPEDTAPPPPHGLADARRRDGSYDGWRSREDGDSGSRRARSFDDSPRTLDVSASNRSGVTFAEPPVTGAWTWSPRDGPDLPAHHDNGDGDGDGLTASGSDAEDLASDGSSVEYRGREGGRQRQARRRSPFTAPSPQPAVRGKGKRRSSRGARGRSPARHHVRGSIRRAAEQFTDYTSDTGAAEPPLPYDPSVWHATCAALEGSCDDMAARLAQSERGASHHPQAAPVLAWARSHVLVGWSALWACQRRLFSSANPRRPRHSWLLAEPNCG